MQKKVSEKVYMVIVSVCVLIANFWHIISSSIANKPGEYFVGLAHYYQDFFLYTSYIAQGARGAWFHAYHMYTSEPLPSFWYYWIYVVIGRIGNIFHFSPFASYDISLLIIVITLICVIMVLVHQLFPTSSFRRQLAVLFVLTASNFPDIPAYTNTGTWTLFGQTWFSPSPALNRLGGVPHQTLQTALLIIIMVVYASVTNNHVANTRWEKIKRRSLLLILTLLSFVTTTTIAVHMFLLIGSIGIFHLVSMLLLHKKNIVTPKILIYRSIPLLLIALSALIAALFTNQEVAKQIIFIFGRSWENAQYVHVSVWDLYVGMGPIALFIPFGIIPFMAKNNPLRTILLMFGIISVIGFYSPLPTLLNIASIRWLSPAGYIVFPIIAAEGVVTISTFIARSLLRSTRQRTITIVCSICIICYVFMTIPALLAQISSRTVPLQTETLLLELNHIPQPVVQALRTINTSHITTRPPVVLTDPALPYDIIVPMFTGKRSFTGQMIHTLYIDKKEALRQSFFAGMMTPQDALQFFRDHAISYVVVSPKNELLMTSYPFAIRTFGNEALSIYTIQSK